ncbi:MAG: hypothetical protein AAF725_27545 [Acidobacteriota bacterium]
MLGAIASFSALFFPFLMSGFGPQPADLAGPVGEQREVDNPFEAVDQLLRDLPLANVAFNTPEAINIKDTAEVHLSLSRLMPLEELKAHIETQGPVEGAAVRVSDRMEARLTGTGLSIAAVTPEMQAVSGLETTEWRWELAPQEVGSQRLHLTLSALLDVAGSPTPRVIRTFGKTIDVEITWSQQAGGFLTQHWQWLLVTLVIPLAVRFWKRRTEDSTEIDPIYSD